MKNTHSAFLFLAILATSFTLKAQPPSLEWQHSYGGSGTDYSSSVQQTFDGGYIVSGQTYSTNDDITNNYGDADYWVVKLDSAGGIEWQKSLGGSDTDLPSYIQQTTDSGYIVSGYSKSTDNDVTGNHGLNDCWIVKLDQDGNIDWEKSLGGSGVDNAHSIQQTSDGGYIICAISNSTDGDVTGNNGGFDFWVVKLDADGNIEWQESLGGTDYDEGYFAKETSDGGYIVTGNTKSNDGDVSGNHGAYDYWAVKLDASGTLVWQKALGGTGDDYAVRADEGNGGYVIEGYTGSNNGNVTGNHGSFDYWLVKLDANGGIVWKKCYGGQGFDNATSLQRTSDNGFIVGGYSNSTNGDVSGNHGGYDYWLIKINGNGALLWQKSFGGSADEIASCVRETSDGGYVATGSSTSTNGDVTSNHGFEDYWVVKLTTDVVNGISPVTNDFVSVYPNPATTQLNIHLPESGTGELTVLNIMGEQMIKQKISSQANIAALDISALPAGTYVLQLSTAEKITTSKFVKE